MFKKPSHFPPLSLTVDWIGFHNTSDHDLFIIYQVGHVALEVSINGEDDDSDNDDDDDSDGEENDITERGGLDDSIPGVIDNSTRTTMTHSTKNSSKHSNNQVVLKFEVSDTGIGMSKKQIKKLFQPFTQADESTTRKYGGTGLGLSIAKKLVDLMNGKIHVDSRVGRGTTFTFTSIVEHDPDGRSSNPSNSDMSDVVPPEDLALLKGTHILTIDDNAVNTEYLVNLLKQMGCDVKGARSGVDGIELAKLAALKEDPYEILYVYNMLHSCDMMLCCCCCCCCGRDSL